MAPAEINILSAGAVGLGLKKVVESFQRETSQRINLQFATAPAILDRMRDGARVDIVVAPAAVLEDLFQSGKISAAWRIPLGRVGVGIMARKAAPIPMTATVDELKKTLLEASLVVFNRASTGNYLEDLFQRLGIAAELERKSIRYPDFASVLDHISHGAAGEIGFGATTVIVENANKGIVFIGPLPAEIQNYTAYEASVAQGSAANPAARQFLKYLGLPSARSILMQAGIH